MNPDWLAFLSGALVGIGFTGGCIFWLMVLKSFT